MAAQQGQVEGDVPFVITLVEPVGQLQRARTTHIKTVGQTHPRKGPVAQWIRHLTTDQGIPG